MPLTGFLNELGHFPFLPLLSRFIGKKSHGQGQCQVHNPCFEKRNQNHIYYVIFVFIVYMIQFVLKKFLRMAFSRGAKIVPGCHLAKPRSKILFFETRKQNSFGPKTFQVSGSGIVNVLSQSKLRTLLKVSVSIKKYSINKKV